MPMYEYQCPKCGDILEILHKMSESPEIKCEKCQEITLKIPSVCNLNTKTGTTFNGIRKADKQKQLKDMTQDLRENHGVYECKPLAGNTFESIYKDIKSNPIAINDTMAAKREENARNTAQRQKEWKEKNRLKRDKQIAMLNERKAQEAYKKRSIST